jgi:hypothetical protein
VSRIGRTAGTLAIGGMQACWLLTALALVQARTGSGPALEWVGMGALLAAACWRGTVPFGVKLKVAARLGGGVAWALIVWAANDPRMPALGAAAVQPAAVGLVGWAWGCRVAAARFGPAPVVREFQLGLLALLAVAAAAGGWRVALPGLAPAGCAFFLLFGAAAAAARSGTAAGPDAHARRIGFALAAANGAAILGVGAAIAALVTPEALEVVLTALAAGWHWAVGRLQEAVHFLASLVPAWRDPGPGLPEPAARAAERSTLYHEILRLPEWLRSAAEAITVAAWVALGSAALWRVAAEVAGWLRRLASDAEGAEIEKVRGAFRRDLIRLLSAVRRRWAEVMIRFRALLGRGCAADAECAESAAARRCYRRLLTWAAAAGCPRAAAQTPYEFLERLAAWRPQSRAAFEIVTEQYVRVRYGGIRPSPPDLEKLEGAWRTIRSRRAGRHL